MSAKVRTSGFVPTIVASRPPADPQCVAILHDSLQDSIEVIEDTSDSIPPSTDAKDTFSSPFEVYDASNHSLPSTTTASASKSALSSACSNSSKIFAAVLSEDQPPADSPGSRLADFRFIGELGRGSFGVVYKVLSLREDKFYVLKKISVKHMTDKQQREALKEVLILRRVRHAHIIRYHTSFVENKDLYIVMEYADGGDLHSLLKNQRSMRQYLSEDQVWRQSWEICLAIQYLHSKRIVHRDLKTLNVLLTKDNRIKVGDLGVSKVMSSNIALEGTRVGTPLYLSPELVKQQPYDFKVDIWALGCTLYTLAALEPPFTGDNLIALGHNIVHKKHRPLPKCYPASFHHLVDRLLQKQPQHRPEIDEVIRMFPPEYKIFPMDVPPPVDFSAQRPSPRTDVDVHSNAPAPSSSISHPSPRRPMSAQPRTRHSSAPPPIKPETVLPAQAIQVPSPSSSPPSVPLPARAAVVSAVATVTHIKSVVRPATASPSRRIVGAIPLLTANGSSSRRTTVASLTADPSPNRATSDSPSGSANVITTFGQNINSNSSTNVNSKTNTSNGFNVIRTRPASAVVSSRAPPTPSGKVLFSDGHPMNTPRLNPPNLPVSLSALSSPSAPGAVIAMSPDGSPAAIRGQHGVSLVATGSCNSTPTNGHTVRRNTPPLPISAIVESNSRSQNVSIQVKQFRPRSAVLSTRRDSSGADSPMSWPPPSQQSHSTDSSPASAVLTVRSSLNRHVRSQSHTGVSDRPVVSSSCSPCVVQSTNNHPLGASSGPHTGIGSALKLALFERVYQAGYGLPPSSPASPVSNHRIASASLPTPNPLSSRSIHSTQSSSSQDRLPTQRLRTDSLPSDSSIPGSNRSTPRVSVWDLQIS
eukprot:GILJ01006972.1.p1 GENE.GILJ01006972.1~~GILJ01006972.1.p1  ORF type:complete len:870 (-),score=87.07 GILJ01006972.1:194-2803(-)